MSKILGIIAAVLLAATALLALKNKGAYQNEINELATEKNREASTTEELVLQKERVAEALEATETYKEQDLVALENIEKVTEEFDVLSDSVIDLEQQYEANSTKAGDAREVLERLPDPEELIPKFKSVSQKLTELTDDIAVSESKLATFTQKQKVLESKVAEVRQALSLASSGDSYPTMRARISSVYPSLGFVVLNAGDNQGVVSGSILDVTRNGQVIGKLKVTAVESGRSTADIVLGSVTDGETVQSGDSVFPEAKEASVAAQ